MIQGPRHSFFLKVLKSGRRSISVSRVFHGPFIEFSSLSKISLKALGFSQHQIRSQAVRISANHFIKIIFCLNQVLVIIRSASLLQVGNARQEIRPSASTTNVFCPCRIANNSATCLFIEDFRGSFARIMGRSLRQKLSGIGWND